VSTWACRSQNCQAEGPGNSRSTNRVLSAKACCNRVVRGGYEREGPTNTPLFGLEQRYRDSVVSVVRRRHGERTCPAADVPNLTVTRLGKV